MSSVDIHKTFHEGLTAQAATFSDSSSMSPTGIHIIVQLGQLYHLIQTIEVTFVKYQQMRCDPSFDPEIEGDLEYGDFYEHPFRELSRRISDLRSAVPSDPILPIMDLFKNFRGWAAHKMTATFTPALYNEDLARGLVPLVSKMMEYATYVSQSVGNACYSWMATYLPTNHENFTEQTALDFTNAMSDRASHIMPSQITLPTGVTCALKQSGFWPYELSPGNKGIVLGLTEDGQFGGVPM